MVERSFKSRQSVLRSVSVITRFWNGGGEQTYKTVDKMLSRFTSNTLHPMFISICLICDIQKNDVSKIPPIVGIQHEHLFCKINRTCISTCILLNVSLTVSRIGCEEIGTCMHLKCVVHIIFVCTFITRVVDLELHELNRQAGGSRGRSTPPPPSFRSFVFQIKCLFLVLPLQRRYLLNSESTFARYVWETQMYMVERRS
jgi:hypothetical protein